MKKFAGVLLSVSLLCMSLAGCGQSAAPSADTTDAATAPQSSSAEGKTDDGGNSAVWPKYTTILGASSGGNGILSVSAIAQVLSDNVPSTVTAQVTAGGNQNILLMDQGEGDFGWGDGYSIYTAKNGLESFEGSPVSVDLCQVMAYSKGVVQLAVRKGSGITCIQDLRGKKVVVGAAGSGTEAQSKRVFGALGLYAYGNYDFEAEYSGVAEGCDLISNGLADATMIGGTVPFSNFIEMFINDKIELIGFSQDEVDTILNAGVGFNSDVIPAGSYDGKVDKELLTVGTTAGIMCRAELPDELVYEFVKTVCEHWDELGGYHDLFTKTTPEEICQVNEDYAPLHPGAKKYYEEMGYLK